MSIPFVGPNTSVITNGDGGKQSYLPYRCDLLPPKAIMRVSHILFNGAIRYGEWNWLKISKDDHYNHAMAHLFAHASHDEQDDHIGHAATRLLMMMELQGDRRKVK